ncbi:MAG TPA: fluoride efflux transporter CrcB [Verrucomicrobiales bacterium]|jgi:CrcB protein|nr:fluoride efflux transporter CrcB [Verrucomicrobiales bacterium]HIL69926.1 fluoride efflux transporter CrcB [Verrucomicrobiota bacterium]
MLRYWISVEAAARYPEFPVGTLIVNFLGSFFIGLIGAAILHTHPEHRSPALTNFLIAGFLGGFTTFSSFSWQTLELCREGNWGGAVLNVALSLILCLLAVSAGFAGFQFLKK